MVWDPTAVRRTTNQSPAENIGLLSQHTQEMLMRRNCVKTSPRVGRAKVTPGLLPLQSKQTRKKGTGYVLKAVTNIILACYREKGQKGGETLSLITALTTLGRGKFA